MARSMIRRNLPPPIMLPQDNSIAVVEPEFWIDPKGLSYRDSISKLDVNQIAECTNFIIEQGETLSRDGTRLVGAAGSNIMAVVKFITAGGRGHLLRFTTTTVEKWDGATWTTVPGTYPLTGTTSDRFCFCGFGNTLIFSNGREGLYEYSAETGSIAIITGSFPAKFLTTFGGRVIASAVRDPNRNPARVRWSVKDNSHDWAGDGSGFEDMLDTPGGSIDELMGVWPVSDTRAFVVRSNSIWQMTLTGYVLAPFRFSRLFDKIGTRAPQAVVAAPGGGIIIVGIDDVYAISDASITPVGTKVIEQINTRADNFTKLIGMYDIKNRRYRAFSIEGGSTVVYTLSLVSKAWSRQTYPFVVNSAGYTFSSKSSIRIMDLVGPISGLAGSIEDLGGSTVDDDAVLMTSLSYVHKEDDSTNNDETAPGVYTDSALDISTGVIFPQSALEDTEVVEAQLEFISDFGQTFVVRYSIDGGVTWLPLTTLNVQGGNGVQLIRGIGKIRARHLQLQLTSDKIGNIRIIRFVPSLVRGGRSIPA